MSTFSTPSTRPPPRSETVRQDVRAIEFRERARLVAWLDEGLRDGRRGRLEAEYPVSLAPNAIDGHRAVYRANEPLAHAMYHVVDARAPEPVRVGMIGLVYTHPSARGLGLAGRCVEACCDALEEQGAAVALLWSDKPAFYERLGFHEFGEETRWVMDADVCRRASRLLAPDHDRSTLALDAPTERDWPRLEALYGDKSFRVDRMPGTLGVLAAAPETLCVVARRGGQAVAYAALGRGDDFHGVVHESAGAAPDVLACFEGLCAEWGPLVVHAGPDPGPMAAALEASGAETATGAFALGRILDPSVEIPSSLYLWGFDSI